MRAFRLALNEGNLTEFSAIFKDDAKLTRPDGAAFEGRESIERWAGDSFSKYTLESELASDRLLIFPGGKKAFDRGVYHLNRTPKDESDMEKESGWYRLFWHKQDDGIWKT